MFITYKVVLCQWSSVSVLAGKQLNAPCGTESDMLSCCSPCLQGSSYGRMYTDCNVPDYRVQRKAQVLSRSVADVTSRFKIRFYLV